MGMKLYIENNQIIPAVKWMDMAENAPMNYTESNNYILDLLKYWLVIGIDYMSMCELITSKVDAMPNGYDDTTEEQKKVLGRLFLDTKIQRDLVFTLEEQKQNWSDLIYNKVLCRKMRFSNAKIDISFELDPADSDDLGRETLTHGENWVQNNTQDLFDWLNGVNNYAGVGFPQKAYYTVERRDLVLGHLQKMI